MDSTKKTARIAGLLYLVNGVAGFFGIIYVPSRLIVSGNAAATAHYMRACAQSGDIRGGHDSEVKLLSEVVRHAVRAVEPGGAHRTSLGLPPSVHQVIDDERAIRLGEKFANGRFVLARRHG